MKTLDNEEKELLENFLNRTFFRAWKYNDLENFDKLELQVTPACDKECTYCYYHNYGDELYPHSIRKRADIKQNLDSVLRWLDREEMNPNIEIFSGDIFCHKLGMEIFDQVLDYFEKDNIKRCITIPTNSSFLADDEITEYVERRINETKKYNNFIGLSLSIDGKYCDSIDRPHLKDENFYSDEYYEKVFSFAKRNSFAFHPMIYFDTIDKWIDNFIWFQEMMKKHDIPWYKIYLLEVRNKGWNKQSIYEYEKFFYYLMEWLFNEKCEEDKYKFMDTIISKKRMNIFTMLNKVGRGLGCSLQSTLPIRLGDLTVNPCHRLSYPHLNSFQLLKDSNEDIVDFKPLNVSFFLATTSLEKNAMPYCQDCLIKQFCAGQCLGACYEYTNEPFLPEPTVCRLFHKKLETFVKFIQEIDGWDILLSKMDTSRKQDLETFKDIVNNK